MGSVGLARFKRYGRWGITAAAIAFLLHSLRRHWQEVTTLHLNAVGLSLLVVSLGITLLAHIWSGWVWGWIMQYLQQPISCVWSTLVYLQTNLLKYLPGNVWHFYGRVRALQNKGVSNGPAIVGVVLEPLLMAAAALLLGIATPTRYWGWQLALLLLVMLSVHPRVLNPVVQRLSKAKLAKSETYLAEPPPMLRHYPLQPFVGEVGFVVLRGLGFAAIVLAFTPLELADLPRLISLFSLAWLAGLVIPGAPGGLGVFEAIAVTLLQGWLTPGVVLAAVALYRLVSTLAEALGAGLGSLDQSLSGLSSEWRATVLGANASAAKTVMGIPIFKKTGLPVPSSQKSEKNNN
jgi:uncharacterized membrane protein YbhN (UPF0104 family)